MAKTETPSKLPPPPIKNKDEMRTWIMAAAILNMTQADIDRLRRIRIPEVRDRLRALTMPAE